MKRLLIFGAGGHGRELAWLARRVLGSEIPIEFVVDDIKYWSESVDGFPVTILDELKNDEDASYIVAIGNPQDRRTAALKMNSKFCSAKLLDPSVIFSDRVVFDEGSVVMPGCVITSNVSIGAHAHLNIGCSISHDTVIEAFSTLSPNVSLAGNVHIEEGAFMGINSTVIDGKKGAPIRIGKGAVVAAGACVTEDVPPFSMVAGVPAVVKRQWSSES